ncbi:hypothetical protein BGZ60DRAFT_93116 [Tricladium varicosporioides]|nr:hypothetical protein BGZ60DRAFT_93116 [Hymenoscyphus varicosporioides]
MPAPGEQHLSSTITNPFEEVKPRISEYTAQEISTLQARLEKQLGPEYISSRAGPSGNKVHYLAAEKCIQLANEVFGFNGWSSQIKEVQVDFVDENPQTFKVSLGLSVIVRVTLRDGTFHEDVGYGHMENCKGKAAAFEKAKKEGTTDALKRALRNFGNVLGNCIYDKEYLSKVTKVKAQPTKWDVDNLHRHHSFVPPTKKEVEPAKYLEEKIQNGVAGASITSEDTFEDEFGDFDDVDFSVVDPDSHPDEVVLPAPPVASHNSRGVRSTNSNSNGGHPNRNGNSGNNGDPLNQNRPPIKTRQQSMAGPPARQQNVVPPNNNIPNPNPNQQPQTPNTGFTRSDSAAGQNIRPPSDTTNQFRPNNGLQGKPPAVAGRILNQPSRGGLASAPNSPARHQPNRPPLDLTDNEPPIGLPPQGAGFFSARAATMLPPPPTTDGQPLPPDAPIPVHNNLPVFNPHAESPSIRKTPGIDHKSSKPTTREGKHVPASQSATVTAPIAGAGGVNRGNILNPQLDGTRRIGVPGSPMSPMANRNQYRPPTIKRPLDGGNGGNGRTPLVGLDANGSLAGGGGEGHEVKRQRVNG